MFVRDEMGGTHLAVLGGEVFLASKVDMSLQRSRVQGVVAAKLVGGREICCNVSRHVVATFRDNLLLQYLSRYLVTQIAACRGITCSLAISKG